MSDELRIKRIESATRVVEAMNGHIGAILKGTPYKDAFESACRLLTREYDDESAGQHESVRSGFQKLQGGSI